MRYASVTERLAGLGSDKWAVHFRARQMKQAGHEIIELTIGEPDIPTPTDMIDVAERAMRAGRTGYSSGRGEPALLAALSAKYTQRAGRPIGPENIMCFSGTQTALAMVMMGLAEEGDEIITGDPLYATYDGVVRATGATRVSVPLRPEKGFRMQAADLEKVITPRSRVLLLNSPHNPTGAVLSTDDIAEIGEVCIRHNLWIVSDEVYELMIYDGAFASPLDRPELADRVIAVASISKSHAAPGFRSGWCIAPKEFTERLLPLSESMLFGGQPFIADMTAYALGRPSAAAATMRESFLRRARRISERLDGKAGIVSKVPQAGMFILADIRATGLSGQEFAMRLLEEELVAVMPGESFGDNLSGYLRLSLSVADDKIDAACAGIVRLASRLQQRKSA
ncbi:pyridoxal phosphate-dependent aminotransferase [Phyllobacterium endophyticum]|uniref:aspartate transaminase n=1 Tax=Phyllobacterium endophyticum TaxID=1149773 RepID=A0A2P7AX46_9HYPH|nr:aminotransferase class I/II-fold pyridoxal phosphate-dependent enzyme [Phyllobacterium endophyticum]PSH58781.1 aminotransferase [Phyllobacterium endophyticum]TYR39407.1 aminotransferase class I/II-fold pyridoxal phosphate-dependent enzyme [Phyllobacterium endophyticum]